MKDYNVQKKYYKQMSFFLIGSNQLNQINCKHVDKVINFDIWRLEFVPAIKTLIFQIRNTDGYKYI